MKNLKDHQYYIDLYDRHTVEQCRRIEKLWEDRALPSTEGTEFTKEDAARVHAYGKNLMLHVEMGEQCLNKEKIIREWTDKDQGRDEFYESAQALEGIRCLTCRNLVKPTFKELWTELNKEDRVLFMYDCPNNCLPRRAFFSNGEEWRVKPDLCPHCETKLEQEKTNSAEKLVTTYACPKCSYTKTDEFVWSHPKEEMPDLNFVADRDRFCLTEEQGKEYLEEKWRMERMGKMVEEWKERDKVLAEKLQQNPKGFHLDGAGYTCFICGDHTPEGDNWYDEYGIKCLVCQKAIDAGEIPALLAKDKDSWYSKFDLESNFNIKHHTLRKWVNDGVIKARNVSRYGNGVHVQLFVIEDNKDFLPPKNLLESHLVNEVKDGKTWHHMEEWYKFVDPFKHLKGYKIMDYMRVVPAE